MPLQILFDELKISQKRNSQPIAEVNNNQLIYKVYLIQEPYFIVLTESWCCLTAAIGLIDSIKRLKN